MLFIFDCRRSKDEEDHILIHDSDNAYTFTLRCISADGSKKTSDYDDYGITQRHIDTPQVTKILSLKEGNKITWEPVPGVARYRVSVKSRDQWKTLGDAYDTSFVHSSQGEGTIFAKPGVEYTYTVTCVSYDGTKTISAFNQSGWSKTYTGEDKEEPAVLVGDFDGNGKVGSADRVYLARHLAKWEGYEDIDEKAADVNADGKVNTKDRIILARHIAKWQGYDTLPYKG